MHKLSVTGHNGSSSEIQVYWNPVPVDIQGYSVRYWAEKEGEETAVARNVPKETQSFAIDRLKPFTVYVIQVTAPVTGYKITGQAKISTDEGGMKRVLVDKYRNSSTNTGSAG